jgi:hypothetical protein
MLVALVAAGMVASALAQDYVQDADEERVAMDKIPAAVKAKADDASRGAKFARAFQDKAKNFRLVGKNGDGALVVVQTTEEGRLVSIATRKVSSAKSVPRAVIKALDAERKKNATLRGFRPSSIEEADVFEASKGDLDHLFQLRGVNGEGDPVQVDVTPEGKVRSAKVVAIHPEAGNVGEPAADGKSSPLPPEIAEAVQMAVPGMRIQGSRTEKSPGGIVTYIITGRHEASGHPVTAEANTNGVVMVVRYDLTGQDVPQQAMEMVAQKTQEDPRLSGFRPQKTQRIELRGLGTTAFAFLGKTAKGMNYELRIGIESGEMTVIPVAADKTPPGDGDTTADSKANPGKKSSRGTKSR